MSVITDEQWINVVFSIQHWKSSLVNDCFLLFYFRKTTWAKMGVRVDHRPCADCQESRHTDACLALPSFGAPGAAFIWQLFTSPFISALVPTSVTHFASLTFLYMYINFQHWQFNTACCLWCHVATIVLAAKSDHEGRAQDKQKTVAIHGSRMDGYNGLQEVRENQPSCSKHRASSPSWKIVDKPFAFF